MECDNRADKVRKKVHLKKYLKNPNQGLFLMHDGKPMTFFLKLSDSFLEKNIQKLITAHGGDVIDKLGPHTVLIVDNEYDPKFLKRPAFNIEFILDSVENNKLLDVGAYKYKEYNLPEDAYMAACYTGEIKFINYENKTPSESTSERDWNEEASTVAADSPPLLRKRSREPYSRREKEAILKFLVKRRKFSRLRGDSIWKKMEKQCICPIRTYQSMKNHFSKTLIYELDQFDFLTEEQRISFRYNEDMVKPI